MEQGRKTYVLLGCEREGGGGSYKKYKDGLGVSVTGTRKCLPLNCEVNLLERDKVDS